MGMELIKEEDVVIEDNNRQRNKFDGLYVKAIGPHIERLKSLIKDSSNGEIEVKIKDFKNLMGEEFKDRDINSFYSMIKLILIESGIKVKLYHHYGANVILSFAKENEIRPSIEINRERLMKTAKKAGYERYADYKRNVPSVKKAHPLNMYDKESKQYFVTIGRKYVSIIFPNAIINWDSIANQHTVDKGGYDWTTSDGLKVKHMASTLRHKVDQPKAWGGKGFERDLFHWGIGNNNRADVFMLTAWGDSKNLDLMKAWIFEAHEIVNGKEFWDRTSFLISTHDRSIDKYSKYEVDEVTLDLIRNKILLDQEIEQGISGDVSVIQCVDEEEIINILRSDEKIRKENIESFYSTTFRTITWNIRD